MTAAARILVGDVRALLPTLESASVRCCVTSPPYFGLRSYLPDGVRLRPSLDAATRDAVLAELTALGLRPISE